MTTSKTYPAKVSAQWYTNKIFHIVFLIIISTILIFYKFDQIPKGLAHDENELARVAFNLENRPFTPFINVADGHGTPYFYILLASFKTFGVNQFALRLPSRIFGIAGIVLFYLIISLVYKKKVPLTSYFLLLTSILLLTSRWYLHFVRISLETPFLLFLELFSLYLLLLYLDKKHCIFLILSGIFAGLAFNSYQPGRIFLFLPVVVLLMKKINIKTTVLYFLIPCVICILPMGFVLLTHPQNDVRFNEQFFLKNSSLSIQQKVGFLTNNIKSTSLMFFTQGDVNGQHNYTGKPSLNPILSSLFILGLIVSFINWKKYSNLLFIVYFILAIIPTLLTYPWENPNMLRTYTALPAIVYFISQSIIFMYQFFRKHVQRLLPFLLILIIIVIGTSTFYELRTYFVYQPLVFKQSFDVPDYLPIIRKNALRDDLWSF